MKVISKEQWETTPKDFKGFIDGEPHLVYLDLETQGTVYGPVKIVDKFLGEYCWNEKE